MPLDAADFISQLSIVDPPGTDPLNQGDDQIRTTKRATQQSFPLIDAAVNISAAQMNQMAIKNEVNTFTQINTFQQVTHMLDGSAGAPSLTFINQQSTGIYRPGTSLGFAVAGLDAAFLLPAQFRMIEDGQVAAPAYSFQNNTNMGMYRKAANSLAFAVGGVEKLNLQAAIITTGATVEQFRSGHDGVAGQPAYSFTGSSNMGMFRQFSTSLGFSVGGLQRFAILAGQVREFSGGTAAIPAYSFQSGSGNMGMYRKAADEIGFSILNTLAMHIKPTTINIVLMPTGPGGGLVSGDLYVKQSQAFAPTELVIGMQP